MSADAWLSDLQGSLWLTHAPAGLVRIRPMGDGRWAVGDLTVSEAELLAARPPGTAGPVRLFHLVHEGWRVASFRRFRPLAYFAAFESPDIFECLRLAVTSLVEQGGWQWEVLVMTAAGTTGHVRALLEPCGLGERLHVAAVAPARDRLDWYLARYRLDAHPVQALGQPLLYLDADIVCDRPLEPLLMALAGSPAIHACADWTLDEGTLESAGHWFGWRLMVEDGMPVDFKAPGFSAGALGFANAAAAEVPFSLVLWSCYADAARPDGGRRLAGGDQPFANYVFRKLGCHALDTMTRFLTLHRFDGADGLFPDPAAARGMVHFLGSPAAGKARAMRAYVEALRS